VRSSGGIDDFRTRISEEDAVETIRRDLGPAAQAKSNARRMTIWNEGAKSKMHQRRSDGG